MALTKIRIGDYFELFSKICNISNLTGDDISGVNREKEFFEPSTQIGSDTSKYKIVPPNHFACNLMHVGRDKVLPIAFNHTQQDKIVSPAYFVFRIIDNSVLLQEYFFVLLKSTERDRYFWFHTDGSIRDGMPWNDFCNLEIFVPPIKVQQKYVDIYNAMVANQKAYEKGLDDLKLVCDGFIEDLRRKLPSEKIGKYLQPCNDKNEDLSITLAQGVDVNMQFIPAKREAADKESTLIVRKGQFAFNKVVKCSGTKLPIALRRDEDCIISGSYQVFEVKDKAALIPEYLMLWMSRPETQRYCGFNAWGSTRDVFDYDELCQLEFPIPDITTQQSIMNIYNQYIARKEINEKLKTQIKDLCPILIKGSLQEA